ncbi:hypothetical protein PR048_004846 [Dryococelus australis]|uniref:Uncharacterized protein n=1 Tax=Dryococelus australis TaxID=614101 RepID=A0ABQ9I7F8_9NEOP|nr:hypothetical protein PR048_004846 [Dryococelus australis]
MCRVEEVTITRSMLTSVRAARRRYQAYLEKKRKLNAEGEKRGKLSNARQARRKEGNHEIGTGERRN